jgi:hypothetical protein
MSQEHATKVSKCDLERERTLEVNQIEMCCFFFVFGTAWMGPSVQCQVVTC